MTAFARVSLTGSFCPTVESFHDASETDDSYDMLFTDRHWASSGATITTGGPTAVLTTNGYAKLLTTVRYRPLVSVYPGTAVDGLWLIKISTDVLDYLMRYDMTGSTYGYPGMTKVLDTGANLLANVWLNDPATTVDPYQFALALVKYPSPVGVIVKVSDAGPSAGRAVVFYDDSTSAEPTTYVPHIGCSATASGVTYSGGYVTQSDATEAAVPSDTAFAYGIAPKLRLTISGAIATYYGENNSDPSKVGDGWPADGNYDLWNTGNNQWLWRGPPSVRGDGSTQYDQIQLTTQSSGGSWELEVSSGRGMSSRFKNTGITAGAIDGTTVSSYSISRTAFQSGLAGEGSATCTLSTTPA
jgi:hypothetical protein